MSEAPVEVELKFAVRDAAALEALLDADRVAGLVAGPWRVADVVDRYVDTAGGAIARGGYAARLRASAGVTTIDLKSLADVDGSSSGAIRRRRELSGAAGEVLDPASWPKSDALALLIELTGKVPLVERFTLRQRRRERDLRGPAGWAVLSLDDVVVEHEGAVLGELAALEIEMRGGDEGMLHDLAAVLEKSGTVGGAPVSKLGAAEMLLAAATGTALPGSATADDVPPTPPHDEPPEEPAPPPVPKLEVGRTPGLTPDDPLAEAGRKVLRFHFARMLGYEAGTRSGEDIEDLHRMRVATRRMRAAWRVFEAAYRPKRAARYVGELRGVAGRLGVVRDLDVLLDGLDAYVGALPENEVAALEPLREEWRGQREAGRRELTATLDSGAYRRFVADYLAFVEAPGAGARDVMATTPHRVRDTAAGRVWTAYEHVRAYDATLAWADVPTIHELRIAGKRLRYTLEFFREVLGPEAEVLIAKVTALQDHLGALNDADVATHLAREFLVASAARLSAPTIEAVGRYLGVREREMARLRRSLPAVWRPVAAETFRRSLGRAVAAV